MCTIGPKIGTFDASTVHITMVVRVLCQPRRSNQRGKCPFQQDPDLIPWEPVMRITTIQHTSTSSMTLYMEADPRRATHNLRLPADDTCKFKAMLVKTAPEAAAPKEKK
jgi:hypothetical protein